MTLSEKMKKIVEDLNQQGLKITQHKFSEDMSDYFSNCEDKSISVSLLQKIFSGQKDRNFPELNIIQRIIEYLSQNYPQYKKISIDYLTNDNITNIDYDNININKKTGLNDEAIKELKDINKKYNNISNDFIINTNESFWKNLEQLQIIKEYKSISKEIQSLFEEKKYNTDYFKNLLIKKLDLQDKIEHFRYIAEFDSVPSEPFQSIEDIQKIDNIINLIESNPSLEHLILNTLQTPYYENKLKYEINQDIILYLNKE